MTTTGERIVQVVLLAIPVGTKTLSGIDPSGNNVYFVYTKDGWVFGTIIRMSIDSPLGQDAIDCIYIKQGEGK